MEIHERFIKLPTTEVNIFDILAADREKEFSIIHVLSEAYNKKISDNVLDLRTLKTYRMILCYKYQSLVKSCNTEVAPKGTYIDLKSFFNKNNEYRKTEEFALLYDIAVLQLILSDKQSLMKSFKDFWDTNGLPSSTENREIAMRVTECFCDSYNLHNYINKLPSNSAELEEPWKHMIMIIISWMTQEEEIEWRLLASLLPKLTITFDPIKIVSPLWSQLLGDLVISPPFCDKKFGEITNLDKKLAALCVMADVCFPSEKEKVQECHYDYCAQFEFWCILNRGLISTIYQQRKQALYLIKRAVEFVEEHKSEIKKRLKCSIESAVPFVCTQSDSSLEEAKKSFFLILEVLEEKQKHLVLPALSHLPSLVKMNTDHESCRDCFNSIWLRCIFTRILQHDNDSIKIFGLREVLKSEPHIFYDDEFLRFYVDSLNNTSLYDYSTDEEKPQIVEELEIHLLRWEQKEVTLINSFVRAVSSITWGPVAIYWILEALLAVSQQCKIVNNAWEAEELRCVEELIKKNLMSHNLQLRTTSQIFIIRILRAYASMPTDLSILEFICTTMNLFSENKNLTPNSKVWVEITQHVSSTIKPADAVKYVTQRCNELFTSEKNLKSFALMITLLVESKLILVARHCPADIALRKLLEILVDADLRPYADQDAILKVIELSNHLVHLTLASQIYEPTDTFKAAKEIIKKLIYPYANEIVKILSQTLNRLTGPAYEEYFSMIPVFISSLNGQVRVDIQKELERLQRKCISIITKPLNFSTAYLPCATAILNLCCDRPIRDLLKLETINVSEMLRNSRIEVNEQENVNKQNEGQKRKFTESFRVSRLRILCDVALELDSIPSIWFQDLLAVVETGDENVIVFAAQTLHKIIKRDPSFAIENLDSFNSIIRYSWRSVFQLKRTSIFISALKALTLLIVSEEFLKLDGAKDNAIECVDQIMREGESMPSLKRIFLTSLRALKADSQLYFQQAFMSCLLHGSVPRRDQRIERAAILHGRSFYDVNQFSVLDVSIDTTIRAEATCILLEILPLPKVREHVLNDLLEILEKNKNKRYFDNSHLHRLKHRVMQILLLMEPFLNEMETQKLYDALCDILIAESNQPSVRLMQEWLLIRLYSKDAGIRETIWSLFGTAAEKRPGSVVSLASVVFHVAHLLSGQTQIQYIEKAILRLLPNCMGQQFNVRLYSQAILVKIYELLPKESSEAKTYREIFNSVEESLRRGNLMKNSTRVLDDFFFKIFDPILDYNLKTIYYELPRLTNVSVDEWISAEVFDLLDCGMLSCHEERCDVFAGAKPSGQSSKPTGELTEFADSSIDVGLSDIQKKIIPWKTMVPFYDDLSEISRAKQRKIKNEEAAIIVVASLIDRPPNLGGLARTCEIFGAKELVIGSLKYAEDREFQTLSVTAEKWLTITEVKPHLLQNYLLEKQSEGWTLVGAEQTANSTNLLDMEFPKKTVLLLGNEKDGIPANLIPLLDTCVEIPQNGVVRSLNVHVTGAICIWQYAKQHVLT